MSPDASAQLIGLRERKKMKTRLAIQRHALRLFRKQGYDGTTIEQIALAAEISPSTFFRYFPTKEDIVMYDVFDEAKVVDLLVAQPAELTPVAALRRTLGIVVAAIPAVDVAEDSLAERQALTREVPQLRGRMLDDFVHGIDILARGFAKRGGRSADDPAIRTLAGAVTGVLMADWDGHRYGSLAEFLTGLDRSLALLEAGLVIPPASPARQASRHAKRG